MSELPSGTVTFLFTDIEGSTKLAQQLPERWETLRERHHSILQSTMNAHNGHVFQIIGDAFCVAFHTATDALNAALDSQRNLQLDEWYDTPIRVRMGIHTGEAELQVQGDYHGYLAMSRVQRLMSAGHGGQVLISQITQELIRDKLPNEVSLRDLGEKRLKDLVRSERIYQLVIPNLINDFPPLETLDTYRHNLPTQLTNFIGREKEMIEIVEAIEKYRLVTLTGSGGTGKTRLSLQVAADLLDVFPDGVWFADLAPVTAPDLIPQTILETLGLYEQPGRRILQTLMEFLHEKHTLLILDNCEHLIEACAQLADALLSHSLALKILASSREALRVKGELAWRVPSLSLPDPMKIPEFDELPRYEAVQLFIDRAKLVNPHFTLTKDNASSIVQICHLLDGIPLALELAAARLKALSIDQISERLDDRFRLLTGGPRTSLPRHQTLRAMIDWSFNLLSEKEKILFHRLAVFVGGWTLEAAESVCSGGGIESNLVLDLMSHLVNKSMVNVNVVGGVSRYRYLETIREYACEKLDASDENESIHDKHLQFFLQLTEIAEPHLYDRNTVEWHDRIEADHDNLRLALDWAQGSNDRTESGLRLVKALIDFWLTRGYLVEGRGRTSSMLAHANAFQGTALYANALSNAAWFGNFEGDFPGARSLANQALAISRELGDKLGISYALHVLGAVAVDNNEYALAENLLEESLQNKLELNGVPIDGVLITMGRSAFGVGNYVLARKRLNEGLTLAIKTGNKGNISNALGGLAEADLREGKYESATQLIEEKIALEKELGDKWQLGVAFGIWAWIAVLQGDWDSAFSRLKESITLRKEISDKGGLVWCLEKLGQVMLGKGDGKKATKLFSAAESIRATLGSTMDPFLQNQYQEKLVTLHNQLGKEAFDTAWEQGGALTMESAIALALE